MEYRYGRFNRDGVSVDFKWGYLGDEKSPTAYFLKEAEYNEGGHITIEDAKALAFEVAKDFQEQGEIHNAMFYVHLSNLEPKVWTGYFLGVTPDKETFFDYEGNYAQFELESKHKVQLVESKSEYIEQGQHDLAFGELLHLRESIDSKYDEVRAPDNKDRLKTLKEAYDLEQRFSRFEAFQKEYEDFIYREQNKLHH